jgi:molybdopterin adenylyltransferase
MNTPIPIGILTVSDRASRGEYEDLGGPAIADYFREILLTPGIQFGKLCRMTSRQSNLP